MDLVSREYGWTDDEVLDLSIARLRQILSNIRQRKRILLEEKSFFLEWQTRQLAGFIAATTGKEGKNLQKEASKISLVDVIRKAYSSDDGLDLAAAREADTEAGKEADKEAPGAADDSLPDWIRNGSPTAMARNSAGTAEALLGGFR